MRRRYPMPPRWTSVGAVGATEPAIPPHTNAPAQKSAQSTSLSSWPKNIAKEVAAAPVAVAVAAAGGYAGWRLAGGGIAGVVAAGVGAIGAPIVVVAAFYLIGAAVTGKT